MLDCAGESANLPRYFVEVFRGMGQVVFCNNSFSGILIAGGPSLLLKGVPPNKLTVFQRWLVVAQASRSD